MPSALWAAVTSPKKSQLEDLPLPDPTPLFTTPTEDSFLQPLELGG